MWSRLPSVSLMRRLALPVMLTSLLSGCITVGNCSTIPLVEYEQAKAEVIVGQIQKAPAELQRFALDAVALRDAVRACRG